MSRRRGHRTDGGTAGRGDAAALQALPARSAVSAAAGMGVGSGEASLPGGGAGAEPLFSFLFANARPARDPALPMRQMDADWTTAEAPTGLTPESLAGELDDFYAGRFSEIARTWEVLERRDGSCAVGRAKRLHKIARAAREWEVVAFDDSTEAEAQAEFLRGFYRRLRAESAIDRSDAGGLAKAINFVCDASGKQYSMLARHYEGEGAGLALTLRHVPMWFFRREKGVLEVCLTGAIQGVPLDATQWVVANTGRGVMEAACITALWKRLPVRQLVNILEKWGRPLLFGKTSSEKGSAGWDNLLAALQALIGGWTGVMGGDATIEQIKTQLETSTLHMPWIEYCNRELTTLWLHSHLGTTAEKGSGTLAGGAQANDTDDLIAADCVWLTDTLRTQVDAEALRIAMDVEEPLAGIQIELPELADDKADLDRIERGVKLGVPVAISFFRERFSLPEPKGDEELLQAPPAPDPFGGMPGGMPGGGEGEASGGRGSSLPRTPTNMGATAGSGEYSAAAVAPVGRASTRQMGNARAAGRQAEVDGLAAAALQPVGMAYAGMLQPLIESVAAAPNLARAADLVTGYAATPEAREALAERVAEAVFAAAMMGLEADGPQVPSAVVGEAEAEAEASGGRESSLPRTPTNMGAPAGTGEYSRAAVAPVGRSLRDRMKTLANALLRRPNAGRGDAAALTASPASSAVSAAAGMLGWSAGATAPRPPEASASALLANAPAEYAPLPFEEARAFWRAKRLVASYADLEAMNATWLQARVLGFKVAGITETSALGMIKDELERGIRGEATVTELAKTLRDRFGLNAKHAEIVVRTNIQSAYQWGHYQQMTDPAVEEALPIWAFVVVQDDRTSDICRPLHGLAYRYNNPIWDSLYPPNHYNCRTTVVAMTAEDALAQGYRIMDRGWPKDPDTGAEFMPQRGFEGNIGKVGLGDLVPGEAEIGNAVMGNYNPYFDSQPRDDHGQWDETGGAGSLTAQVAGAGAGAYKGTKEHFGRTAEPTSKPEYRPEDKVRKEEWTLGSGKKAGVTVALRTRKKLDMQGNKTDSDETDIETQGWVEGHGVVGSGIDRRPATVNGVTYPARIGRLAIPERSLATIDDHIAALKEHPEYKAARAKDAARAKERSDFAASRAAIHKAMMPGGSY